MLDKKTLSERDICTKFINPALQDAGWDLNLQVLEEVSFTAGKIYVKGKLTARGERKRADYILYYNANPVAVIEAKDNNHTIGAGLQQALGYAATLDIPCVFSSNGDGFLFHDRTATGENIEQELSLDQFPSPADLWERYKLYKNIQTPEAERIVSQPYFEDGNRRPRYYQEIAINRTVEAVAKGQNRVLLVMATGTGKTYTAFQIIYRLWKAGVKKRILFLADRNALIDQTKTGDFKHFRDKMTVVRNRKVDKSYEIYLALYQGLAGTDEAANAYKEFSSDFFDLVVIDECHRGSAAADSSWREILRYFNNATHLGLTATPKETTAISNSEYFGDPIYTYSLKQGIDDGFLAPYRVVRIGLNVDLEGWRPDKQKQDYKRGVAVEDRIYNRKDFDKSLVIDERTDTVAKKLTEFLKGTDRFSKTIVFCVDIDHAERMRSAIARHNSDLVSKNYKYVMQITGDNDEGKRELDNFINPEERYPVIATTSKLMTTGVDAQTCKVIVLDSNIQSITEFKQIIGRGTRVNEAFGKLYFTILDFRNVTDLFADPDFDGEPVRVKEVSEESDISHIEDEEEADETTLIDDATGETIIPTPVIPYPDNSDLSFVRERTPKQYVNGVDVSVLVSREMYFDNNGKPITTSLKDHTKAIIQKQFASLDDFLSKWNEADRKAAIIKELEEQGVLVGALQEAVNKEVDLFDLICHVAFDQPPLTRKERAAKVKKRNYFTKYGEQARRVLEALLEKYADEGITTIESTAVLSIEPFTEFGTPPEIIRSFGNRENYLKAIKDLEKQLYQTA